MHRPIFGNRRGLCLRQRNTGRSDHRHLFDGGLGTGISLSRGLFPASSCPTAASTRSLDGDLQKAHGLYPARCRCLALWCHSGAGQCQQRKLVFGLPLDPGFRALGFRSFRRPVGQYDPSLDRPNPGFRCRVRHGPHPALGSCGSE